MRMELCRYDTMMWEGSSWNRDHGQIRKWDLPSNVTLVARRTARYADRAAGTRCVGKDMA